MSSTPRKRRNHQHHTSISHQPHNHNHNHHQGQGQGHGHQRTRSQHLANQITSDYESDTASYMAAHPPTAAPTQRTNEELNVSVLRRYLPGLTDILSVAANAVVYSLNPETGWEKAGIEGTLFICRIGHRSCVFVLNRKALENLSLMLDDVNESELSDTILMLSVEAQDKIWGLFIHADQESTRVENARLIETLWRADRAASRARNHTDQNGQQLQGLGSTNGGASQASGGRQVSINELFGR